MQGRMRKFFFGLIFAVSILALVYTLVLYARHQVDGLQALLCMNMGIIGTFWFVFHLREAEESWPLSIQPVRARSESRNSGCRERSAA